MRAPQHETLASALRPSTATMATPDAQASHSQHLSAQELGSLRLILAAMRWRARRPAWLGLCSSGCRRAATCRCCCGTSTAATPLCLASPTSCTTEAACWTGAARSSAREWCSGCRRSLSSTSSAHLHSSRSDTMTSAISPSTFYVALLRLCFPDALTSRVKPLTMTLCARWVQRARQAGQQPLGEQRGGGPVGSAHRQAAGGRRRSGLIHRRHLLLQSAGRCASGRPQLVAIYICTSAVLL